MLNELLDLPGYFVKDMKIEKNKIYIHVEPEGCPICPSCSQSFIGTTKDFRKQTVEDLSVFGTGIGGRFYRNTQSINNHLHRFR